jgi:hypothetical protein
MAKKNFKKPMKLKEQSRTMKLSEPSSMLPSSMANLMPEQNTTDSSQFDSAAKSQMKPIGTSGTELFAGYFSEEYLQLLRGRKGAKIFDEMRRSEAQVAMLLSAVMNPIKSGVWEFEAASDVTDGELIKNLLSFAQRT